MITVGVGAQKTVHVGVALNEAGQVVGEWSGGNTVAEWRFRAWLAGLGAERQVGIEGAGGYGYGLSRALVAAAETVLEVNSRLTALGRRHARRRGKSDSLDAQAVPRSFAGMAPRCRASAATRKRASLHISLKSENPS